MLQPPPAAWDAPSGRTVGSCPQIRGTFASEGLETGLQDLCRRGAGDAGRWNCSHRLDEQFRFPRPAATVSILQPDADTVILQGRDAAGVIVETPFSRSRGDFACDAGRLIFATRQSLFAGGDSEGARAESALATLGGLMVLRGGVRILERRLHVSQEGHLVMNIMLTNAGVIFPFPFRASFSAWLKWPAAPPDAVPATPR